ncbi:Ras-related protein Rab-39B [Balamuthia mandrillaris]
MASTTGTTNATTATLTAPPKQLTLGHIPPELLLEVFSHLRTMEDLCSLGRVCRLFANLSRADCLWRPLGCASWQQEEDEKEGDENFCWKQRYMRWLNETLQEWKARRPFLQQVIRRDAGGQEQVLEQYQLRLSLVGPHGAGKSSFHRCFEYDDSYITGSPYNYTTFELQVADGHNAKILLWNICGAKFIRNSPPMHLMAKHGLLICYDSTDLASFQGLDEWLATANESAEVSEKYRQVARLLVACKCDQQEACQVSEEMAEEMAAKWGAFAHIRTSTKTRENVQQAVRMLVEATLDPFARLPPTQRPNYMPSLHSLKKPVGSSDQRPNHSPKPSSSRCLCQ